MARIIGFVFMSAFDRLAVKFWDSLSSLDVRVAHKKYNMSSQKHYWV